MIFSPSFSGCKYFLTLINDFSRRTWVYFLKIKSGVFDKFLAYKALVEKQFGRQPQILRTYNGGLIFTGSDPKILNHVKTSLKNKFEMTDLGYFHYFLGLQVLKTKEGIFLS
jgi:hypothetical protein